MASDKKALWNDIQKKGSEPHKAPADKVSPALVQAKTFGAIQKGNTSLKHVNAPSSGLSSSAKANFLEDRKGGGDGSFIEKLDAKSLEVFNAACSKNSSGQAMFFLNAFWDEYGDQAEFIYAVSNQIFRLADMKAKGIQFIHQYEEGKDLDFDMGIYFFEQLCKFTDDPGHEWFRGSNGVGNWAAKNNDFKKSYEKSLPAMMTSIKRKGELKDKVDVNFDGRVSMLEYLLYQYNASPKSLIERSMGNPDIPEEVRAALAALAEVQKRVNEYEAEKSRLEAESKQNDGKGVKALGALNLLAQLTSSPLWESINKALIIAEAKVRIAQKKYGAGGTAVSDGAPMRNNGTLWWMDRELREKQERYGKKK